MLIRPAIGDSDPIRYRRPTPDGQVFGNIIDEAMRVASNSGYRRLVQQFQCSMAVLELLARATEAWVVAAGNEHLVNRSSRTVDGVSRRCTAGKTGRMDVAGGWRYQFHERLMSRIGILVSLD